VSDPTATGRSTSDARLFVVDSAVQLVARVATLACSFAVLKITTVELGAKGFGAFTAAMGVVGIATVVTGFGLPGLLARDLAKPDAGQGLLATSLALRAVAAVVSMPVVWLAARALYGTGPLTSAATILAPTVVFTGLRETLAAALLGSRLSGRKAALDVTTGMLVLAAIAVAAAVTTTNDAFLIALPAVGAATALAAAVISRPILHRSGEAALLRWLTYRDLVRRTAPFFTIEGVNRIYVSADALILAAIRPASQVGAYGVAYAAMSIAMAIPTVTVPVVLPMLVRADEGARRRLVESLVRVLLLGAVPLACVGPVLAGRLVRVVSSTGFSGAAVPLAVLLIAAAISFANAGLGAALFADDDERFLVRSTILVAVTNVLANLVLDHVAGARGAAASMVLTEALSLWLLAWRYVARTGHHPVTMSFVVRLAVAGAAAGGGAAVTVGIAGTNAFVDVAVAAIAATAVYSAALFVLGLRRHEIIDAGDQ
jgi:polysaccharide transporter, PST family